MENIDIPKLVEHIKEAELMRCLGKWEKYTKERGLGRQMSKWWHAVSYEDHVTGLYTLRAYLRGRIHRKNPPACIRDFNRTMEETGRSDRMKWDMEEHNQRVAEAAAQPYLPEEEEDSVQQKEARPPETKGRVSLMSRLFGD